MSEPDSVEKLRTRRANGMHERTEHKRQTRCARSTASGEGGAVALPVDRIAVRHVQRGQR
jgi:hypothetical protein